MNRQRFLALGLGSMGSAFLSHCAHAQVKPLGRSPIPTLSNPITSTNGLLDLALEARYQSVTLAGSQAKLLVYNGQMPGPRMEVRAGDRVKIAFTNHLSQPTNMHYHGLHVSPQGHGDNPFLEIQPQAGVMYDFQLPTNHPAGLFWYHPHHHHYVADQISGGLSGLFVVRGDLDEIPEVKAAQEEFLVLKDFALDRDGELLAPTPMERMQGREGNLLTVNGQVNPTLTMPEGGLLRLRILNASVARFYRLSLENHPLYLIATDGGALSTPIELSELLLVPGERADLLIKGDQKPNSYRLLDLPYDRGGMGMMGGGMMGGSMRDRGMMGGRRDGFGQRDRPIRTIATLAYQGATAPQSLPAKLIPVDPLPEPQRVRRFDLASAMGMGRGMGMMGFTFNGRVFTHDRIDTAVTLNQIEDWELMNSDFHGMDHPFHLHVNSFQVIERNGMIEPYLAWRDMVLVKAGETVKIRVKFADFTGKTVYHCHIADHEDLGMMGTLEIS